MTKRRDLLGPLRVCEESYTTGTLRRNARPSAGAATAHPHGQEELLEGEYPRMLTIAQWIETSYRRSRKPQSGLLPVVFLRPYTSERLEERLRMIALSKNEESQQ